MDNRFYWKSNKLEFIIGSNFFIYHFDEFAHTALTLPHLDINTKFSLALISLNFYLAKLLTGIWVCVFISSPPKFGFVWRGANFYGEI